MEFQHVFVVLFLQQQDVLLEQDDVQVDVLLAFGPPRQGTLVDQSVFGQLEILQHEKRNQNRANETKRNENDQNGQELTFNSLAIGWSVLSNADLSSRR